MSQDTRKTITVRLSERLTRAAKADAALEGQQLQDWYRQAVEDRLRRKEAEKEERA